MMMLLCDLEGKIMEKEEKEKLSLKRTIWNAWYAVQLAATISPGIVIHSFFLWIINHAEWVFFDGIFAPATGICFCEVMRYEF